MLKCVFFDVSGTLVDSENTINFVDRKFMVPWLNKRGYGISAARMREIRDNYSRSEKLFGFGITLLKEMKWRMKKSMLKEFTDLFFDLYFFSLKPFPSVVSTLQYLKRKGLKLVVLSNSSRKYVDRALEKIDFRLDDIITYDDTKYRKASLKPFQHALKKHSLEPPECLMVGDRLDEDSHCRKVGIKFAWFPQKKTGDGDYDFVIKDFGEIKKVADSLMELKEGSV